MFKKKCFINLHLIKTVRFQTEFKKTLVKLSAIKFLNEKINSNTSFYFVFLW